MSQSKKYLVNLARIIMSKILGTKFGPANNKSLREFLFFSLAEQSKHLLKGVVSDCFSTSTAGIKWPIVVSN